MVSWIVAAMLAQGVQSPSNFKVYSDCVINAALDWAPQPEPATVVADAALAHCVEQRLAWEDDERRYGVVVDDAFRASSEN
ncbi:MAG: hypothetical protein ACTHOJ_08435, partial [Sphingomonas oligoaromativorans]